MAFNEVSFGLEESDVVGLTPDQRTAVEFQMTCSIFNEGPAVYRNYRYPRYRNFYGYAQLMSGVHVVKKIPIRYLNQELLHWRDISFGINETIGCYFKAYGLADLPTVLITPITIKTRQRYTGVRFRFVPGVLANCSIVWETGQSACGSTITDPAHEQGQPPAGANGGYNPGSRPPEQGGDGSDPSPNDGNYDPDSGLPEPPAPGRTSGQWYYNSVGTKLPGCTTYSGNGPIAGATNGQVVPQWVPQRANIPCPEAQDGIVLYGGVTVQEPTGVLSFTFYFVPSPGSG